MISFAEGIIGGCAGFASGYLVFVKITLDKIEGRLAEIALALRKGGIPQFKPLVVRLETEEERLRRENARYTCAPQPAQPSEEFRGGKP